MSITVPSSRTCKASFSHAHGTKHVLPHHGEIVIEEESDASHSLLSIPWSRFTYVGGVRVEVGLDGNRDRRFFDRSTTKKKRVTKTCACCCHDFISVAGCFTELARQFLYRSTTKKNVSQKRVDAAAAMTKKLSAGI